MSRWRRAALGSVLAIATLCIYAQVRDHVYLNYDDDLYVVENPKLELGLSRAGIAWALTTDADGLHIPVAWLSYLLDSELWGLEARGVLLANVAYHTLSGLLLFLALSSATGAAGRSAFVAAVFLLHPVHAESVAWASERKDVLCALFFNATLLAWVGYVRRPTPLRYLAVLAGCALALGAKPMAVTLPAVLLLLDFWPFARLGPPGGRIEWRALRRPLVEKIPLTLLSAMAVWITYKTQQADGVMRSLDVISPLTRVANACLSYVAYPWKALWPTDLRVFYPYRGEPGLGALAAGAGVLALTLLVLRAWRRAPYLAVGWFWYLGMLVPVIGLVQVGQQAMADRYAYLPLVGIGIAVAWGGHAWGSRLGVRALLGPLAITLAVAMTVAAHREVSHWRDGVTLFGHALEGEPRDPSLRGNFGIALLRRGDVDAGVLELATAFGVREPAAAARARVAAILQREAEAELQARRPPSAIALLRAALAIEPEAARLHDRLARALFLQGRYEQAFAHFDQAELEDEALADLHARAAGALLRRGDEAGALLSYRAAIVAAGRAAALERSRGREGRARKIEDRQRDWQARASDPTAN